MKLKRISECDIQPDIHQSISELLQICFDGYPSDRITYNQLPTFRYLIYFEKNVVGHAAIDHRMIRVGDTLQIIWGISDFCIHPDHQSKGWGKKLMKKIIKKGKSSEACFLVLTSDDSSFYTKLGFERQNARARWVMIHHDQLFGIHERTLKDTIYVFPLDKNKWPQGAVDFLGTLF